MRDDDSAHDEAHAWQMNWANLLRTARQVAGLSLSELSAGTQLSRGYLSKLESGHATALNPSRATLAALAHALPSFRTLAHMLDPTMDLVTPALARTEPQLPPLVADLAEEPYTTPVRLGWRELEVVIAVLTLEQAALRQPVTRITVARATGRPAMEVEPLLESLVRMGVLARWPAAHAGASPAYERAPSFAARTGIVRLGDALLLAAALLGQAPRLPRHAPPPMPEDDEL
jgi:transcriptional regulator with XRE-family HTH domain